MLPRQARLRAEWGPLYPALRTGEWEGAAALGDRLLAESLLSGSVNALQGRTLPDAHFEFRGGVGRGGERAGIRRYAKRTSSAEMVRAIEDKQMPGNG